MNGFVIKIIALISMTIDHVGIVFFDNNDLLRFIGRAAFPLYSFLLVVGFMHTKDNTKKLIRYFLSLLLFAIISEVLHDNALYNSIFYLPSQNILFTLFCALGCLTIYEKNSGNVLDKFVSILIVLLIACLSQMLFLEYGLLGILFIFLMYIIYKSNLKKCYFIILYILLFIVYFIFMFIFDKYYLPTFGIFISLIPIIFYDGNRGYKSKIIKYFFYLYYPLHLLLLCLFK